MSIKHLKTFVAASAAALAAPGAAVAQEAAAVPMAPVQGMSLPTAGSVAAIYNPF